MNKLSKFSALLFTLLLNYEGFTAEFKCPPPHEFKNNNQSNLNYNGVQFDYYNVDLSGPFPTFETARLGDTPSRHMICNYKGPSQTWVGTIPEDYKYASCKFPEGKKTCEGNLDECVVTCKEG